MYRQNDRRNNKRPLGSKLMIPMESVGITNGARLSDRQGSIGSRKARHIRSSGGSARRTGLSRTTAHGSVKGHIRAVRIQGGQIHGDRYQGSHHEHDDAGYGNGCGDDVGYGLGDEFAGYGTEVDANMFHPDDPGFRRQVDQGRQGQTGQFLGVEWSSFRSATVSSRRFQISTKLRKRSSEVAGQFSTSDTHAHTEKVS